MGRPMTTRRNLEYGIITVIQDVTLRAIDSDTRLNLEIPFEIHFTGPHADWAYLKSLLGAALHDFQLEEK